MAGLVPAIHCDVAMDPRYKPGDDGGWGFYAPLNPAEAMAKMSTAARPSRARMGMRVIVRGPLQARRRGDPFPVASRAPPA
jgi:hypothetical protein